MPFIPSSLEQNLESVLKIVAVSSKFGVLVGGICVIAYSLRINYFPQDLSVGDGLLFIMAAACFGVIYAFFVGSLVSLGITVSPATRGVFQLIVWGHMCPVDFRTITSGYRRDSRQNAAARR